MVAFTPCSADGAPHPFLSSYHHHLLWCPAQVRRVNKGSTRRPSTPSSHGSLPPPYLVQPLCTPSPLVGAWTTSTPGRRVCDTPSLDPVSSTSPSRCRPPPYFAQPLCTPPPLVFAWAMSTPPLVKHPAPLNASWGLAAPRGYLGLVPSPSPYQRLVWCLAARRGTCSSHGRFPLLSDLRWSTHPPSSWPGSGTSSVLPRPPARPGGPGLRLWASATCLVAGTSLSRPWLVLTAPWLFRCSLVRVWASALRPLSPLPIYIMTPLLPL